MKFHDWEDLPAMGHVVGRVSVRGGEREFVSVMVTYAALRDLMASKPPIEVFEAHQRAILRALLRKVGSDGRPSEYWPTAEEIRSAADD